MNSLIEELQRDALDKSVSIADLLRKALVVSTKLSIDEMDRWINDELGGYQDAREVPKYRTFLGQLQVKTHFYGYQPLHIDDPEIARAAATVTLTQSVAGLENLLESEGQHGLVLHMAPERAGILMKGMEDPLLPSVHFGRAEVVGALNAVRNHVLQWALALEKQGILGSGLTFSREEKQIATQVHYQVTNHFGSVTNSQIHQVTGDAANVTYQDTRISLRLLDQLESDAKSFDLSEARHAELKADLLTIRAQLASPAPKRGVIAESFRSIRSILEAATGNVVGSVVLSRLAELGQSLGLG